ncbi:energy-coupling factor ABC transporter ATP-binding protein [Afifella sp. IM 167]|uniref:energy-coupling factor ABC transporter ATP-binding protein n=1 Tax=Afifella sp. IM 167 TaxID=2033586 RepID=UPI001CC952E8|nr:ABC transporter ATP-binding protein [Afifella sp. IM 167]MBZ8135071.1 energy-coupling factor ABC transporter ATP-binding protein [Afifella sp. IM 167]
MSELITLSDVHFAYPGGPPVLRGASLTLLEKQRLCIGGHNGAGKSTLLQVIVGLLKPQAGRVLAFGSERRKEKDFHEVRRRAGLVFQDPDDQLFCPTVAEDVAFGPLNLGKGREEAMAIVDEVLARLDLSAFRDRITHKLSGGEKRLVTLAAVLAMQPDVLLLDEPTNALDVDNKARLREILLSLPQAMILVSHDHRFRREIATRTLFMVDGRIEEREPRCR